MSLKKNIKKMLFVLIWITMGTGTIILLVAAVNVRKHQVCSGYDIDINGKEEGVWFIDKQDILKVLTNNGTISLKNKKLESFNLDKLEAKLRKEVWVKDAELYFNNNGVLKVKVVEREPIARVFSVSGESFYIDSSAHWLPLSPKMSARLPVFTSFPVQGRKIKAASDKNLMRQIRNISEYILNDPFWMAQIAQIDVTAAREFEMVPTVGNHIIEFGSGDDYEKKFQRLFTFYRQVMARSGMEKYSRIKVQYDKQVIGVKKATNN